MPNPNFRFYREHKFVRYALNEFECSIEQADFTNAADIQKTKDDLANLKALMQGHAQHEDEAIHQLLRDKGSTIHEAVETEHKEHDDIFQKLERMLQQIVAASDTALQIKLGYQFNLLYRNFVGETLNHFHKEETLLMPELEKLYTVEELRQVEFNTYHKMTADQMVHMMAVLFPHFNRHDREAFLRDIQDAEPERFKQAWAGIKSTFNASEQQHFEETLKINV